MLFGQVQAFIEVARTGNVSRAAEALYVTQPALTARIQALEKELGEPLFVRTGRQYLRPAAGSKTFCEPAPAGRRSRADWPFRRDPVHGPQGRSAGRAGA